MVWPLLASRGRRIYALPGSDRERWECTLERIVEHAPPHLSCYELTFHLIVSGGSTDVGVAATVFEGRDLDYHQIVVRDACGAREQRVHDMLMDWVFPRMGRVRTTDQVVQMLAAAKAG